MPRRLVSVKNEDGADVELGHFTGYFGYGVMLFDAEEFTLMYDVADTGHIPLPDRQQEIYHKWNCGYT